jgi:DNA polymerase IV
MSRKIIHVDMDCFYAAVEVKYNPELRGKALGVGGPPNTRSVLCTASYEARKFGVRAAMPSSLAVRLCPQLVLVPPNFQLYKKESQVVQQILRRFSDRVEPLSLDEAYLDVTGSSSFEGSATKIAQEIRALIKKETGLSASAGVAPNKFLAKVASDWKKPDGLFVIPPSRVADFVRALPVGRIPGVGQVTEKRLLELGLRTCADIQLQSLEKMKECFGSRGVDLFELSRGQDDRSVESHWERKSLTVEETFNKDVNSLDECRYQILPDLYRDWEKRMRAEYRERIRGFVVKAKYFDFKSTTHEMAMRNYPTLKNFDDLFCRVWARRAEPLRLIGLGVRLGPPESEVVPYQLRLAI